MTCEVEFLGGPASEPGSLVHVRIPGETAADVGGGENICPEVRGFSLGTNFFGENFVVILPAAVGSRYPCRKVELLITSNGKCKSV